MSVYRALKLGSLKPSQTIAEAPGSTTAEWVDRPVNYATYDGDEFPFGIGSPYCRALFGEWENSGARYAPLGV